MWSRNSVDPLARLFLDRYGLHLLARPRENVAVYDVFAVTDGRAATPGSLEAFVGAELTLPEITLGEKLADVSGTTSDEISGKVGFDFLGGFLAAIGAQALVKQLSAVFSGAKTKALRFRFSGATRDSTDPFAFERSLRKYSCSPDDLLMREGYLYHVALAVHRTDKLSVTALDEGSAEIDLSADIVALGEGTIQAGTKKSREVTIVCSMPMAYGVELSQLIYNEQRGRLELAMTKGFVQTMAEPLADLPGSARSMIGGPHDSIMLNIEDYPS